MPINPCALTHASMAAYPTENTPLLAEKHDRACRSAFDTLIETAVALGPLPFAVVHPCSALSLQGALESARRGLINPILVGPKAKIRRIAESNGLEIGGYRIDDAPHSHAAAAHAVGLVHTGKAAALMNGALHTGELMTEVMDPAHGLRTERRVSHVFALDVPAYPKPLFLTDGAINKMPDLLGKRDIIRNAIELAHAIGIETPKVAILSAVDTVNPAITSTIDAAALCRMCDRGQITGAELDGPLAFDSAVSVAAAAIKGIHSPVAGHADILVVPDLMSGNMLAKQMTCLANATVAGIVLGARVPIALTSRSNPGRSRLVSYALARLLAYYQTPAV